MFKSNNRKNKTVNKWFEIYHIKLEFKLNMIYNYFGGVDMKIKITKSARKFGYLIWNKKHVEEFRKHLSSDVVDVYFNDMFVGQKRIDWKYNRISIGYRWTRALDNSIDTFNVNFEGNNTIKIKGVNSNDKE